MAGLTGLPGMLNAMKFPVPPGMAVVVSAILIGGPVMETLAP